MPEDPIDARREIDPRRGGTLHSRQVNDLPADYGQDRQRLHAAQRGERMCAPQPNTRELLDHPPVSGKAQRDPVHGRAELDRYMKYPVLAEQRQYVGHSFAHATCRYLAFRSDPAPGPGLDPSPFWGITLSCLGGSCNRERQPAASSAPQGRITLPQRHDRPNAGRAVFREGGRL